MTRLAQVVQEALDHLDWQDTIDDDEAAGQSQVATGAIIDGQPCDIFINTHEQQDAISVFVYLPFRVKAAHYPEACMLVNAINVDARHGHLEILPETGKLRLVVSADVEGASPGGIFVVRMLQCGEAIISHWLGALAAVAVTGRPAAEVLAAVASDEATAGESAATADKPAPEQTIAPPEPRTLH